MAVQAKQIARIDAAYVGVSNFSANGGSSVVTTAISDVLATAGNGGVSVPLQVSSGVTGIGVVTTGVSNKVEIWLNATKAKVVDSLGNEVYGRLTQAGGVYTLTYFSLQAGVETAYSFGSATAIDFIFLYRFDFERRPADAVAYIPSTNWNEQPVAGGGDDVYTEQVTVTAANTLAALTHAPVSAADLILYVNGVAVDSFGGGSAAFSLSGSTVTWSATNAGFTLATTDRVVAQYLKA